jgi:prefoldin subunit 5
MASPITEEDFIEEARQYASRLLEDIAVLEEKLEELRKRHDSIAKRIREYDLCEHELIFE